MRRVGPGPGTSSVRRNNRLLEATGRLLDLGPIANESTPSGPITGASNQCRRAFAMSLSSSESLLKASLFTARTHMFQPFSMGTRLLPCQREMVSARSHCPGSAPTRLTRSPSRERTVRRPCVCPRASPVRPARDSVLQLPQPLLRRWQGKSH
jgi:hypothetical protein